MRKNIVTYCLCAALLVVLVECRKFAIDKQSVCNIKKSCFECLRLDHCNWCPKENRCFSSESPPQPNFCKNGAVSPNDFGLSIDGNAECSCNGGELEHHCYPPGVTEGAECSGRGTCECGRCVCNATEHPTQTVLGEYCEFDNFSCDDPDCDEGPYPLSPPEDEKDTLTKTSEIDTDE